VGLSGPPECPPKNDRSRRSASTVVTPSSSPVPQRRVRVSPDPKTHLRICQGFRIPPLIFFRHQASSAILRCINLWLPPPPAASPPPPSDLSKDTGRTPKIGLGVGSPWPRNCGRNAAAQGWPPASRWWRGCSGSRTPSSPSSRTPSCGHDVILLGERGQAKTRLIRSLVGLLNEWLPIVGGSEINDDPYNPTSRFARLRSLTRVTRPPSSGSTAPSATARSWPRPTPRSPI